MVVSTKINLLGCRIACKINLNWIKGNVLKLMRRDYLLLKSVLTYQDETVTLRTISEFYRKILSSLIVFGEEGVGNE